MNDVCSYSFNSIETQIVNNKAKTVVKHSITDKDKDNINTYYEVEGYDNKGLLYKANTKDKQFIVNEKLNDKEMEEIKKDLSTVKINTKPITSLINTNSIIRIPQKEAKSYKSNMSYSRQKFEKAIDTFFKKYHLCLPISLIIYVVNLKLKKILINLLILKNI